MHGLTTTIRQANQDANPLLNRIAFKMATGSGKTVVMAMLIAWHALNKFANTWMQDFPIRAMDYTGDYDSRPIEVSFAE